MNKKEINEVDFSEIFDYAGEKFGVDWNRANDMFFNNSLTYESYDEYDLSIKEYYDKSKTYEELSESDKGYYIIYQFMIDNNVNNLFIDNR